MALNMNDEDQILDPSALEPQEQAASPAINPAVMQYLQSQNDLKDAQSKANTNQLYAGLARASGTLANSIGGRQGALDTSGYNALDKSATAPVDQAIADQTYQGKQIANDAAETSLDKTNAENDPDSAESVAFRKVLASTAPFLKATYGADFDNITAADKSNLFDMIKMRETIEGRKQEKALAFSNKAGATQDKTYTELTKAMETFKGNKAVATAESNKLAADNAMAMLNGKDLDNLNPTQIRLFNDELAKIATGGVPGEHGIEALMPNTLQTKIAQIQSFLSNSPTGAKAGDFLRQNLEYLKELRGISAQKVTDYRSNLLKGYKNRVKPEDLAEAQATYGLGAGSEAAPAKATQSNTSKPKTVTQNGHTYTLNEATGEYE